MEDVKCAVWGFVHHCGKYLGPRLFDTLLQGHLVMQRDGGGGRPWSSAKRGGNQRRHTPKSCCKHGVESIKLVAMFGLEIVSLLPTKPPTVVGYKGT
jgi:hypothetical protein